MTEREFVTWISGNTRAEWADGEVIMMAPASFEHVQLVLWLSSLLRHLAEAGDLGEVLTTEFLVRLPRQRRRRMPDILFVAQAHLDRIRPNHLEGAPDLVMEVVSPDSVARDWREKYHEYEKAGVSEYWIVDPSAKRLEAYGLDRMGKYRLIEEKDGKVHSTVLKGLYVKPAWLWKRPLPKGLKVLRELGIRA